MALAPRTAQNLPECLRLGPITVLQPASMRPSQTSDSAVSRLSGGVVDLDPVEELLVALGRAGEISSFQRGLLQVHYLRDGSFSTKSASSASRS
jgi:hypothetical protein